ncbi:hypothetical protein ACSSAF_06570 [Staphylococcus succinus]|uniref:hypothetical protein n=1 Tax=Staphylococcus succinus TaxID=61015 RepID=UPI003F5B3B9F
MVYKYEQKINEAFFRANRAGGNVNNELLAELQEIYRKAKAFDEIREFIIRKLKEEEEKTRTLLDDYEYGLYQAYDNIDDIIREHLEDE